MEHKLQEDNDEEEPLPADVLMNRGAALRRLRELELADQVERAEISNNETNETQQDVVHVLTNGQRLLKYESFLRHQRYYDDLKHVDCNFIDYGSVGNGRLVIEQKKSLGKGGLCWDAAFILAEHLIAYADEWNKPTLNDGDANNATTSIVELGSGTGLCGLIIAKAVECHVDVTDLPQLLPLMTRNVRRNFESSHIIGSNEISMNDTSVDESNDNRVMQEIYDLSEEQQITATNESIRSPPHLPRHTTAKQSRGTVSASILQWGVPDDYQHEYDLVIGADVVASLYDPIALAETMHALCHDESIVYVSFKERLTGPHTQFEQRLSSLFENVKRIQPTSRNRNPRVWILKATGKK